MASGATTGGPASGSLYIGDLSDDVTEAVLFDVFKEVGPIISIRVCRDAVTRRSLGYAYVNYQNPMDAERALETLNYHVVKNRAVRIMWSQRDPALRKSGSGNVFIKNMDKSIDNKALFDTFSAFGNILSCKVVTDKNGESRGYGFVHFETDNAAKESIERVNGMLLNGAKVFVGPFVKRVTRVTASQANYTNVYVKELIDDADADLLKEKFSEHGEVTSTFTKKHPVLERVFGFVNFAEHDQAVKAVENMNDKEIAGLSREGAKLYVARAQKRAEREAEMRRKLLASRAKRSFPPGNNLYVKNLEEVMTESDLRAQFETFGEITSCVVMKDAQKGVSKGFGFVCFKTPEAANKALQEMNGKMVGTKPLYVNVAQRKEVRRSMLEMQYAQRAGGSRGAQQFGGAPGYGYAPMPFQQYGGYNQPMRGPPMGMGGFGGRPGMYVQPMSRGRGGVNWSRGGYMPHGGTRGGMRMAPMTMAPKHMPPGGRPPAMMQFGFPPQPMGGMMGGMGGMPGMPPAGMMQQRKMDAEDGSGPLTAEALAAMSPEQQKNALGEQLYHKISGLQPSQAAKITGMLLEMDVSETLNLLESPDLLKSKIAEAMAVLRAHEAAAQQAGR